jgi:hypothetical protein
MDQAAAIALRDGGLDALQQSADLASGRLDRGDGGLDLLYQPAK